MIKRKRKGSLLLEVVISIMILLIATTLALKLSLAGAKSFNERGEKEEANRIAYAIENEVKYNVKIASLIEKFNNNTTIKYEYTKNLLNNLTNTSLLDLNSGNGIEINKVLSSSNDSIIKIKVTIKNNNKEILCEREFIKSDWMDK
jgi:flagellar basal body-associated protein FliL